MKNNTDNFLINSIYETTGAYSFGGYGTVKEVSFLTKTNLNNRDSRVMKLGLEIGGLIPMDPIIRVDGYFEILNDFDSPYQKNFGAGQPLVSKSFQQLAYKVDSMSTNSKSIVKLEKRIENELLDKQVFVRGSSHFDSISGNQMLFIDAIEFR
ncbi:hypothetical protein P7E02_05145 [Enterococcus hulanensis]|uniref:hypothetical protein n=1 Tax=Enterococcus hulanensis TaxID=2559929 RepID=UPI00288E8CA5|nr:hypothetical protein [Enterococcus hulanensis]MDT2659242.1 hypothetical protein [Enterococcus hulanensis]